MAKGKPWFGKRWTKSLIGWLDTLIFNRDDKPGYVTMGSSFCINFTIGLVIGACTVVLSLFMDEETLMPVISYGTVGCSLLASVAFLYKNLGFFSSIWAKIGRCLFVVVLNLVACLGAFLIGMWTALLALVCLVMWGILSMWLGDSTKSSSREKSSHVIYTGDGPLYANNVDDSESYLATDGHTYRKVGGNFVSID